jgi:hypothetical protein
MGVHLPEQPGLEIDDLVELLCIHLLASRQIPNQSGVESAGPGAHGHPGGGSETHACVNGLAGFMVGLTGAPWSWPGTSSPR